MSAPRLFDPGLQPERTLMSWQRTTLALMVGIAAAVHYVAPVPGGASAVLLGVTGIVLAVAAYAGAHRRYRATTAALLADATLTTVSAWPLLLLTVAVVVGAVVAVVFAIHALA